MVLVARRLSKEFVAELKFFREGLSVPRAAISYSFSLSRGLGVRGLYKDPGVQGACFFLQNVVRAVPGRLVAPYRFAFSCQPLRICGCLDLYDGKTRRELAFVEP